MFQISLLEVPKKAKVIHALGDPAIDQDKLNKATKDQYGKTLNTAILPIKPDQKPLSFHVKPLSDSEHDAARLEAYGHGEVAGGLKGTPYVVALRLAAFRMGTSKVADVPMVMPDGEAKTGDLDPEHWGKLPLDMRAEIGAHILTLTDPPKAESPADDVGKSR